MALKRNILAVLIAGATNLGLTRRENINFFGFITVDIEAELAKLIEGWRPLRPTTVTDAGTTFLLNP